MMQRLITITTPLVFFSRHKNGFFFTIKTASNAEESIIQKCIWDFLGMLFLSCNRRGSCFFSLLAHLIFILSNSPCSKLSSSDSSYITPSIYNNKERESDAITRRIFSKVGGRPDQIGIRKNYSHHCVSEKEKKYSL
jgi:hypothetical protein